jgi:hypothetical protein
MQRTCPLLNLQVWLWCCVKVRDVRATDAILLRADVASSRFCNLVGTSLSDRDPSHSAQYTTHRDVIYMGLKIQLYVCICRTGRIYGHATTICCFMVSVLYFNNACTVLKWSALVEVMMHYSKNCCYGLFCVMFWILVQSSIMMACNMLKHVATVWEGSDIRQDTQ